MRSLCIFITCICFLAGLPATYGQTVTSQKKISGHFSASRGKLIIDNRYGKLDINTWDKNEVSVAITITAKAPSQRNAQGLLDKVRITEPADKGTDIYYKTAIGASTVSGGELRIDYVVSMPRRHAASFTNKYGDIELADAEGKLTVDLEYGNLKTADITGGDKDIRVSFGNAVISSIEQGNISASYAKLFIDRAGSIGITNQSGNTTLGAVRELNMDQRYGDLKIGSVTQLKGTAQYTGMVVDKLLKSAELTLKYCKNAVFSYVGPDADNIIINASFSNLSYHFDKAASLSADITAAFGRVSSDADNVSLAASGGSTSMQASAYKMKIGKGRGNMSLKVSYGNVLFK